MGNNIAKSIVKAAPKPKAEHFEELTKHLENSESFKRTVIHIEDKKRSFINKIMKTIHDAAFPEHKINEKGTKQLESKLPKSSQDRSK